MEEDREGYSEDAVSPMWWAVTTFIFVSWSVFIFAVGFAFGDVEDLASHRK